MKLPCLLLTSILFAASFFSTPCFAADQGSVKNLVKPSLSGDKTAAGTSGVAMDSGPVDKIAKVPTLSDDQKTAHVLNGLAAQSGWFPKLKIFVSGGMVTIEGHVKDADQLSWLAKTADRLPTVIAVINKAEVDQPSVTDLSPAWKEFLSLLNQAKRGLPLLLLAAVLISVFFFLSRFIYAGVHSMWNPHIGNPFLLSTVTKITMVPIWLILFYLVLQTAGLSSLATTIIGGTGALGIVLGFAFKDIAENYLSGLLLAIRSPFTKGDDVTVAGFDGYVQALNMRGTTILAYDGTLILVPNSIVIQSVIKNRSTNPNSRSTFSVGISAADSVTQAIDLIYQVLGEIPAILKDPQPLVIATELFGSSVMLQVRFWIDSTRDSLDKTKSSALARAKDALLASGFSIPDPTRELVLTDNPMAQEQRTDSMQKKAHSNVARSKLAAIDTKSSHDDQVKKLGDGLDMMKAGTERDLT